MNPNYYEQAFDLLLSGAADRYAEKLAEEFDQITPAGLSPEQVESLWRRTRRALRRKKLLSSPPLYRYIKRGSVVAASLAAAAVLALNANTAGVKVYKIISTMDGTSLNFSAQEIYQQYRDISKFKNKDEIIVPKWLPSDMELVSCDDDEAILELEYRTNDDEYYIRLTEFVNELCEKHGGLITENNQVEMKKFTVMNMEAIGAQITNERGHVYTGLAWTTNATNYELVTNLTGNRLEGLLDDLTYYQNLEGKDNH